MKISILGSGWLGLPLANDLRKLDHTIKLSTRSTEKLSILAELSVIPYLIDIDDLSNEIQTFLASELLIINITSKNKNSFAKLIREIEQSKVKKILFISSSSVYQTVSDVVVTEDNEMESPVSLLYQIEQMFMSNTRFKTTILRFSGLIGYSRHPGRFFSNGKVVNQPDAPVNLIHRDDCIGIIIAIIKQASWGNVFNGCATTHPTKREFYSHARSLLNMPVPEFNQDLDLTGHKEVSNQKVIKQLGYQFIHPDVMKLKFD
tara:strand:- start:147062 stop:147844 length:783 start_codon:yes stop_codon:yes gene_type:complete